jgi:hypothetical protein
VATSVKQFGGYIADERQTKSEDRVQSEVTIKVPVDKFDQLLNQLPKNASKTLGKTISTDDVTGVLVDVKSRLQAREQKRLK